MPFTFLPHQAAVLPLKLAWPRLLCGQALVFGSMAPDFEFFLNARAEWGIGHSIAGQFVFCLPLTLAMVWIVSRVIARPLATNLPDCGAFHLREYALLAESARRPRYWLLAIPSALIGSFSHIIWDSFTHGSGWSAQHFGYAHTMLAAGSHHFLLVKALQYGCSFVGALITLVLLHQIGSKRLLLSWAGVPEPPQSRPSRLAFVLWLYPIIAAIAAAAIGFYLRHDAPADPELGGWSSILLRAVTGAFVGLCFACMFITQQTATPSPTSRSGS